MASADPTAARFAGWRVALRVARRDALRSRGRSALVIVMIGLPVLLSTAIAVLTARLGQSLTDTGYRRVCRALGFALLAFALQLAWQGLSRLAGT